jgi:hypothetical protein
MLTYSPLFVYKQERIIRFQLMNQRRNEKLHPDGQYTDHLSMGGAFLNDIPNLLLISLLFILTNHSPSYSCAVLVQASLKLLEKGF